MGNAALVQVKTDIDTKETVSKIYESLGLDLPTAVRIFFKKSIAVGGLPFDLRQEQKEDRWSVYESARNSIQKANVSEMSLEEINAEIAAVRNQVAE